MNEWVCVYVEYEGKVLLVKKNKPAWQKGRLNLPGGSVEPGEMPIHAATRELKEEAGLEPDMHVPHGMGKITGDWGTVHCFYISVEDSKINPREGETEEIGWWDFNEAIDSGLLIPNLKAIIPMMSNFVYGWTIYANDANWESGKYEMKIEFDL